MAKFRASTRANVWRLQASFNRKVERLKRNSSTKKDLIPRKITNEEIINLINNTVTSRDLKREVKKMERFIKKGGEKVITYEGEEMLRSDKETLISLKRSALGRLRSEVNLELERIGNPITYKELVKNPKIAVFYGHEIGNNITKIKKIRESVSLGKTEKQRMYEAYTRDSNKWLEFRDNFIQMIVETAHLYGIPYSEYHEVVQKLKQLSGRNFAVAYRRNQWLENMIYGYHEFMQFSVDSILENTEGVAGWLTDWENFKQSIGVLVEESK